jgi:GT2 family glycosyltransferase
VNRYPNWELLVVDNGSRDGSPELIKSIAREDARVRLIRMDHNVGPAKARNVGVANANGGLFAFLDNDTVVDPDWLLHLVTIFVHDRTIGACQCKLLLDQHRNQIDYVGDYLGQFGFLIQRAPSGTVDVGQFDDAVEILSAKSAAMAIRREAFEAAGGFDDDYFIYVEETDLGWRTWLAGYRIVFVPESIVYHVFGTSSVIFGAYQTYLAKFHGTKNYVATLVKNLGTAAAWRIIPLHIVLWFGLAGFLFLTRRPRQAAWVFQGLWWCWINRDTLLRKRRAVQQRRRVCDRKLLPRVMQRRKFCYYLRKATTRVQVGNATSWGAQH